jgi:hypothetical protein
MRRGIYFASATPPLRYGTNLSSGIYLASATPPLRYGASLPFGVYLAPAAPPLRHTLIAVVGRPSQDAVLLELLAPQSVRKLAHHRLLLGLTRGPSAHGLDPWAPTIHGRRFAGSPGCPEHPREGPAVPAARGRARTIGDVGA